MKFSNNIHVIDSHTMGEPTRIIVGGTPRVKGETMAKKKEYLINELDYIRTSAMHEPRGHNDMFGSIITSPSNSKADFGIVFMDGGGYLNMCGHGSIGAATVAVETGMVDMVEPITKVNLDTPAGLISADVHVEEGSVKGVSIVNVPAFLYKRDIEVEVDGLDEITFDIAFGGSFFAIINAKELGLKVDKEYVSDIKKIGMQLLKELNEKVEVEHPELEHINTIDLIEIYEEPESDNDNYKNVVVFGQGQFDRSPCGTGTSAKMATLFSKGLLDQNEEFIYESILGTKFKGEIVGKTKVGDFDAIIPKITGAAYITGFNQLVIDSKDPVKHGFNI